jgi:hypothetical protein
LKKEIDRLDDNDVKNVERVKAIFLNANAGDLIFSKLKSSINKAEEVASIKKNKAAVLIIRDSIL